MATHGFAWRCAGAQSPSPQEECGEKEKGEVNKTKWSSQSPSETFPPGLTNVTGACNSDPTFSNSWIAENFGVVSTTVMVRAGVVVQVLVCTHKLLYAIVCTPTVVVVGCFRWT